MVCPRWSLNSNPKSMGTDPEEQGHFVDIGALYTSLNKKDHLGMQELGTAVRGDTALGSSDLNSEDEISIRRKEYNVL